MWYTFCFLTFPRRSFQFLALCSVSIYLLIFRFPFIINRNVSGFRWFFVPYKVITTFTTFPRAVIYNTRHGFCYKSSFFFSSSKQSRRVQEYADGVPAVCIWKLNIFFFNLYRRVRPNILVDANDSASR